jgi:hypothetical protein
MDKFSPSSSDLNTLERKNAILSFKELNSPLRKPRKMDDITEEDI